MIETFYYDLCTEDRRMNHMYELIEAFTCEDYSNYCSGEILEAALSEDLLQLAVL